MATINIGFGTEATNGTGISNQTTISTQNPSKGSGTLDTYTIYIGTFYPPAQASGVKVGTFHPDTLIVRDYANLGNLSAGSLHVVTGLSIDVEPGDLLGQYISYCDFGTFINLWDESPDLEYYVMEDGFDGNSHAYALKNWTLSTCASGTGKVGGFPIHLFFRKVL
jgi:hypothetical protein